jgi:hypothetical protein
MRAFEFLREQEEQSIDIDKFEDLRNRLIAKIQRLPAGPKTLEFLEQIKDNLRQQGAASRIVGLFNAKEIKNKLSKVKDSDRSEELNDTLARYILSAPGSTRDKREFMALLSTDKLIDRDQLFSYGKVNKIENIIKGYSTNEATKNICDGLAKETPQGIGPGEILMIALSSSITKLSKGDLYVKHPVDGEVELKTSRKGGARFKDDEVTVQSGYDKHCEDFRENYLKGVKIEKSGLNLKKLMSAYDNTPQENKENFKNDLRVILDDIFPQAEEDTKGAIMNSFTSNDFGSASKIWAKASFENYKKFKKTFNGVLYLNHRDGTSLYFKDWDDIIKAGGTVAGSKGSPINPYVIRSAQRIERGGPYPQLAIKF